jgi:hypothetical protein
MDKLVDVIKLWITFLQITNQAKGFNYNLESYWESYKNLMGTLIMLREQVVNHGTKLIGSLWSKRTTC